MNKFIKWFNTKFGWFFTNGNKSQRRVDDLDDYLAAMDAVHIVLYNAKRTNLEVEVIYEALKLMKQNPTMSISEAIRGGHRAWVK